MTYELREGQANIFKNDRKENPNAPDWRGEFLHKGQKMKIALWEKNGAKGLYLSAKITEDNWKPKVENRPRQEPEKRYVTAGKSDGWDEGDNIPFAPLKGTMVAFY